MDDLRLDILTTLEDGALVIRYGVDNLSARDLYLLNRVHDRALEPRQDLCYVELDTEHRLVHVYKDIPPIPHGRAPTMPYAPYVTPVRSHKRFGEVVRIAVPVHEQLAYDPVGLGGQPTTYSRLRFTIGYYWSVNGMQESERRTTGGNQYISPLPPPGTKLEFGKLQREVELSLPVVEPVHKPKTP